jgi:hypothetical protein
MKWSEIKEAVERSGVSDDDEILEIHCELSDGDKALHPSKQGDFITLSEYLSDEAQRKEIVASAL